MMMMMVAVIVVVMVPIRLRTTGLMEGLAQLDIQLAHQFNSPGDLTGEVCLAIGGHGRPPFFELLDMPFVVFYPVLQHDPQFFDVIHSFSP